MSNFVLTGYLTEDEINHVCTSYSTAYQMNISPSRIQQALKNVKNMDSSTELINIGLFCRFLDDVLFR